MIGLDFDALTDLLRGRAEADATCPACSARRSTAASRRERVLHLWQRDGFVSYNCVHCGVRGYVLDDRRPRPSQVQTARIKAEAERHHLEDVTDSRRKARSMWARRRPITGSVGETYLRTRGYRGLLPPTLGFLPAWREHPPAVIAAFGMAREIAPGEIAIDNDAVFGAHLIKLMSDGSDRLREDNAKITIGQGFTAPIMLAPPNDLLALTIAEGIEDALSDHQISGAGAWTTASAGRMPGLATLVPSYIECVTILVDDNDAGRSCSHALASALHARDIEVLLAGAPT